MERVLLVDEGEERRAVGDLIWVNEESDFSAPFFPGHAVHNLSSRARIGRSPPASPPSASLICPLGGS
ncbi:hypothetical protein MRX96_032777 [Rhipicephalus microplus]